jgi:23S rRNA pseudouridine1911/1915/1917 synthase
VSCDPPVHHFEVPKVGERPRLDQFLCGLFPEKSRSQLQEWVRQGAVWLNGEQASKPGERLRGGERLEIREPKPEPIAVKAENLPLEVLFEDEEVLVLNKAAGMVVHPAVGNWSGTVVNALLHHCEDLSGHGGENRPGIVHRLDKETSGCLVVAKTDSAHRLLSAQFADRKVRKIYLAVAVGCFRSLQGTVDAPIGRHPVHRQKMAVLSEGRGRSARTDWRVLWEFQFQQMSLSLVECHLHSGRTHQIRVHLAHLGHGLLGDSVYGKKGGVSRQMLHAWQLGFTHPKTGQWLEFVSQIPDDFVSLGVSADRISLWNGVGEK